MPRGAVGGTLGRVGASLDPPDPPSFDSFATEETVGPIPWWETGGPTGTVQPRNVPYKSGFAFRATTDIALHGARIWAIGTDDGSQPGPTDHAPKLRFGPAVQYEDYTHSVDFDDTQPAQSGWRTVMFDEPIPIAANFEGVIYISSYVGSNAPSPRQVARSEGGVTGEAESGGMSIAGLMQSLEPQGWYSAPPGGDETEDYVPLYGRTNAWYWIDPLVTPA